MGDVELVTIHHAGLGRHDRVTLDAARAMAASGWEVVDDLPVDPPVVPFDVDPDTLVDLVHPALERECTVPAGAARALLASGWQVAPADPDQAAADEQALLVELSGLTPEQLAHLTDPADTGDPTTPDTED